MKNFQLKSGTIAGTGQIQSSEIDITGMISPDNDIFDIDHTRVVQDKRYGTLMLNAPTLQLNNASVPFTMNFDIDINTNGNDNLKDLLVLQGDGSTVINGGGDPLTGTIHFLGILNQNEQYLVIKSEGISDYNLLNSNKIN